MNERIKLLAEQAGFSFKYKTAPDELNPGHKLQDLEKFAELIVRECVKVVDETMTENQEMNIGLVMASAQIVAHFGVEE